MKKFCEDVLKFLDTQYNDSYTFSIDCKQSLSGYMQAELKVRAFNSRLTVIVNDVAMNWLYELYRKCDYVVGRGMFLWQKELIDLIEGA